MDYKTIKKLALSSYQRNNLDEGKVNKIASFLKRSDLKKYIRMLKNLENSKNITVFSPLINLDKKPFEKLYPGKKIIFKKDPSLLLGLQIVDNDMVYNFTLKNTLDRILEFIEKNYN